MMAGGYARRGDVVDSTAGRRFEQLSPYYLYSALYGITLGLPLSC